MIIIEIENPLKCSFNSFIWNFYYRKFLKDDGTNFVCNNEFNTLLNKLKIKNLLVKVFHTSLKTIKGILIHPKTSKICPKCRYNEAVFWQEQIFSADEPMVTFFRCLKCNRVWREY